MRHRDGVSLKEVKEEAQRRFDELRENGLIKGTEGEFDKILATVSQKFRELQSKERETRSARRHR